MNSFQTNDLSEKIKSDLRLLATVVMASNDAVTIQDFEGNISAWNKGARNMYGYTEAEALAHLFDGWKQIVVMSACYTFRFFSYGTTNFFNVSFS